jgi:hypothetical protein
MANHTRRISVDRIEGDRAVLIFDGETFDVPLALLPPGAAEGHVYSIDFARDEAEEARLRQSVADRLRRLARDDDGGDFSL